MMVFLLGYERHVENAAHEQNSGTHVHVYALRLCVWTGQGEGEVATFPTLLCPNPGSAHLSCGVCSKQAFHKQECCHCTISWNASPIAICLSYSLTFALQLCEQ